MLRKRKNGLSAQALDNNMMRLKVKNAYVSGPVELKYIMSMRKPLSDKRANGSVLIIGGSKVLPLMFQSLLRLQPKAPQRLRYRYLRR